MSVKNKILDLKDLKKIKQKFTGKKIVLCHGVFDLLHVGHISYFKSSKIYGNILPPLSLLNNSESKKFFEDLFK